jgi:hypothetical protein
MLLTRTTNAATLSLPDDLLWLDEHAWSPVVTSTEVLLTGALLIQSATRLAGRPITLAAPADMAWVPRSTVVTLAQWAADPLGDEPNNTLGNTLGRFTLSLADGRIFQVAFRHSDTAVEAEPVLGFASPGDDAPYRLTLRLIEL